MNIKDVDFAIEVLSHPQRGDESDINMALDVALKSLKAQRGVLEQKSSVLADMLMESRIRGELTSDTTYSKDVIPDVQCKLTVSIQDRRPCYCGAELREVWRRSEDAK